MVLMAGAAQAFPAESQGAGWEESGEASWYGGGHNGRRTSSGTVFNDREMTAAHATLPLGSRVRVTMQETGQSVVVTITDRQPYKRVRVIDLSRGAAAQIGLLGRGTGMVTVASTGPGDIMEVAEAPEDGGGLGVDDGSVSDAAPRRHGRRHMRLGGRVAAQAPPCCHAPSVVLVRRSVRHPATRRML